MVIYIYIVDIVWSEIGTRTINIMFVKTCLFSFSRRSVSKGL